MYTLKKSLGQHFLRDENMVLKIIAALRENHFQQLLEIGPGGGALTKHLINIPGIDFKAVELDDEKIAFLENTYPSLKDKILHSSILDIDQPFEGKFTVIGNFPYNISSQILFKILDWRDDVEVVVGMFQKEVAQRVAAKHGNKTYGILSVLIQAFFDVEYLFEVHENCFNPPPKVKSGVIRLTRNERKKLPCDEQLYIRIVKACFNQRRKMIRNTIKPFIGDKSFESEYLTKRPEQLSVEDFIRLTLEIEKATI
ncbi:MAG: 16S rRNA (adenine(1518)-N(6)/adenine(1519)-N(6))-dimethyltransferase RsmA [Terrimonas sp.]|nr:16S rRNA (adenine(1518)-N(6)/adenine(1519)-N(6))-dimethyltransferase RsmA [Terrimonas sp.]